MNMELTPNAQAILLLTAPLIAGRRTSALDPLSAGEYKRLARLLRNGGHEPSDLLGPDAKEVLRQCQPHFDTVRLENLLERGFLLSQVVERWQARAIWVVSRADGGYPRRLKKRLREDAPPILYGCGDATILNTGGLAVIGSRNVDDELIQYAEDIGRTVATARRTLVSGGARGIDQAAMRGALNAGGKAVGVLADILERAAIDRAHRELLMNGQLTLISPYDPAARFNVGHAMQRNKLIYALSDAALVVNSDYQKGGTWAGAVEQLDKLRFVTVYVRSNGQTKGLEALRQKGALLWPDPVRPEVLAEVLDMSTNNGMSTLGQDNLLLHPEGEGDNLAETKHRAPQGTSFKNQASGRSVLAEELFAKVKEMLERMDTPKTNVEVAEELQVSKHQANEWLQRLVKEGVLVKLSNPTRYCSPSTGRLF